MKQPKMLDNKKSGRVIDELKIIYKKDQNYQLYPFILLYMLI